jgi:hypothetical protein
MALAVVGMPTEAHHRDWHPRKPTGTIQPASPTPFITHAPSFTPPSPAPTASPAPTPVSGCAATVPAGGNIQSAINSAASGQTVCLTSGASYNVGATTFVDFKTDFTLDGRGATVRATTYFSGVAEIFYVRQGVDITFKNVIIVGTDPSPGTYNQGPEFQAGIAFAGTQGATVDNVTTVNTQGDGVGFYAWGSTPARDITIVNSDFIGTGRWGVTFTHAERALVANNITSNTPIMYEFEPDAASPTHFVRDIMVRDNVHNGAAEHFVGIYGPGLHSNITLQNNVVNDGANRGIWSYVQPTDGFRATNIRFLGNRGFRSFYEDPCFVPSIPNSNCNAVIYTENTDGITVTGNVQPVNSGSMYGVLSRNSTGEIVNSNTFSGAISEFRNE